MKSPARVAAVKYIDGYRLLITFKDGSLKVFDMQRNVDKGGIFEALKDLEFFRKVRVHPGAETIEWPNGADICPDTLYRDGIEADAEAVT